MTGIVVRDGETIDSALRRFNKVCEKNGVLSDFYDHQYYEKPSERRRRKKINAKRKNHQRRVSEKRLQSF